VEQANHSPRIVKILAKLRKISYNILIKESEMIINKTKFENIIMSPHRGWYEVGVYCKNGVDESLEILAKFKYMREAIEYGKKCCNGIYTNVIVR
jgi:hypothetical protein